MRTKLRSSLLAALVVLSPVAAQAATVINFDVDGLGVPIAGNTPITNQYANLGVLFEGLEDGSPVDINAAPDPDGTTPPSGPNVMTNCSVASLACPGNRADIVRITFGSAVSDISLSLSTLGSEAVSFNLYDTGSNLLETQSLTTSGSVYMPVAFSASGVSFIEALQPGDSWAWAFDDLTFTVTPVPVPAPLLLLGAGIFGLAAVRQRNRA